MEGPASRYQSLVFYRAPRPVLGLRYGQAPLLLRFTRQLLLVSWVRKDLRQFLVNSVPPEAMLPVTSFSAVHPHRSILTRSLQMQVKQPGADACEDRGLEALALWLAREALSCVPSPASKPYIAAVCKVRQAAAAVSYLQRRSDGSALLWAHDGRCLHRRNTQKSECVSIHNFQKQSTASGDNSVPRNAGAGAVAAAPGHECAARASRGRRRGCRYFVGKQTLFHEVIFHKHVSESYIHT